MSAERFGRRQAVELTAASCAVLFQELALIRWLPGQVRVLAYFPNLILLSAFLGLGLGCLRAGRRSLLWSWPIALAILTVAAAGLGRVVFTQESVSEHLWLAYFDLPAGSPVVHDIRTPIVLGFLLSAATFVGLGQLVAERLQAFRDRGRPLVGYACDILGSLLGVAGFALVSFLRTFPVVWFALVLLGGLLFFWGPPRRVFGFAVLGALVVLTVHLTERGQWYSPYYALSVREDAPARGMTVMANGSLHQHAEPVRRSDTGLVEFQARSRVGYHLPFELLGRPVRRALVLGAGTGNDVAVMLDEGVEQIDAVEIDPVILELGRRHPDQPYASPRVRVINADARSFLNNSRDEYDLVVFGTLDSMTVLSALSSVRLDNFVYTAECIRAARARLRPDGGMVLYFRMAAGYIDLRLGGMLTEAFGQVPYIVREDYWLFNRIYLAGPAFEHLAGAERRAAAPLTLAAVASGPRLPTDDWPYLYLSRHGITPFYWTLMLVFAGIAVLGVLAATPRGGKVAIAVRGDWEMFCFGLAFLLLETRAVTQMNLVWGATWLTSAVVFGAILLMILGATLLAQVRPLAYATSVVGLAVTLVATWALPPQVLLAAHLTMRLGLSIVFVGAPIFFAASAFAVLFGSRAEAARAFGWNLLGAVAGGLLEFLSMVAGLRALLLVALGAYLVSVLIHLRTPRLAAAE